MPSFAGASPEEDGLRCPECGHENPVVNNFCGICGGSMHRTPGKSSEAPATPPPNTAPLRQNAPRVERHVSTTISGPSVLGLGSEPSPRNVDYLLHDEEDSHAGRRWFLRILGIVIIAGLGWWAWQSGNLAAFAAWFKGGRSQPTQVAESGTPTPPPSEAAPAGPPSTPPSQTTPAPAGDAAANKPPDSKAGVPAEDAADPTAAADQAKAEVDSPSDSGPVTEKPAPMISTPPPAKPKEGEKPAEARVKKTSAPKPAPPPKAPARSDTTTAVDDRQVAAAERYLYGKGVATNCDRALGILRPAAEKGNAKARSQLGALYSTGHCVARDLPNAYRWFALALRVDHDNATVEQNLQMIWRQMSPAERQLAIKLTQ